MRPIDTAILTMKIIQGFFDDDKISSCAKRKYANREWCAFALRNTRNTKHEQTAKEEIKGC